MFIVRLIVFKLMALINLYVQLGISHKQKQKQAILSLLAILVSNLKLATLS